MNGDSERERKQDDRREDERRAQQADVAPSTPR